MNIEITDDDISYAENLVLPPGCNFNEERRAFIRCMESRDVVACPGSGKTTALLAKLLILARKMPFADGRGICVLTHTNVAIDEIRKKAADASVSLFRYPNFFGTIHSFAATYLGIPQFADLFGHRQVHIDEDYYQRRAYAAFEQHRLHGNGVICSQLRSKLRGVPRATQGRIKKAFFRDLDFRFEGEFTSYCRGDTKRLILRGSNKPSRSYAPIHAAKFGLLSSGCLRYEDLLSLAELRIRSHPNICALFCSRFKFVFIDEMQDCDERQISLLDAVFPPHRGAVIQRIGDPNQAIYHDHVHDHQCWSPRDPLTFSDSRRFGGTISRLLSSVRVDDAVALQPCERTASHPPYLLTYQPGDEQSVIRAFSHLIHELSDRLPTDGRYSVIGWVGRRPAGDAGVCIATYFPGYTPSRRTQRSCFRSLVSFTAHAAGIAHLAGAKGFLQVALQGVAQTLELAGVMGDDKKALHTPSSLKRWWRRHDELSYYEFCGQLAGCFLRVLADSISPMVVRDCVRHAVESRWTMNDEAARFLSDDTIEDAKGDTANDEQTSNQYVADDGTSLYIGTVHSVKGETHTGTLLMETCYQGKTDGDRLIEFLKGNRPRAELRKTYHVQSLKIAHVAFSRPTHLLAFSCRQACISGHEDSLAANGWVIRRVRDLISSGEEAE